MLSFFIFFSRFTKLKLLDKVFAQLCSVLPSAVMIPHCYVEAPDVIRITAQPNVNFYN